MLRWWRPQCGVAHYAEGDGLRDVRCAAGHLRRHLVGDCLPGAGDPAQLRLFIGGYYLAVLLTSAVLIAVGYMVLKKEVFRLLNMLKDPVLVAFTTSSSEAAYPKTLERLVKFGCSRNIVSFVLPIGTRSTSWARWSSAPSPRCLSLRPITYR